MERICELARNCRKCDWLHLKFERISETIATGNLVTKGQDTNHYRQISVPFTQ